MLKLTAKCPHCGKHFEAEIAWPSKMHRSAALRRLDRYIQGHMQICFKNPQFGKVHEAARYEVKEVDE